MQAIRTMLPEFPSRRNESEAAPRRRARHRPSVELLIQPFDPLVELLPRSERFALARHDRTKLSVALPRREVLIRLLRGDVLDSPLYPNLTAEWPPVEEKRGLRVRLELASLPGRVMRVEDEPALIEALQEHHPHRGRPARTRRRERRGLRHLQRRAGLGEPPPELLEGVGGEIGAEAPPLPPRSELRPQLRRAQGLPPELAVRRHEVADDTEHDLRLVAERAENLVPLEQGFSAWPGVHGEVSLGVAPFAEE